MTKKKNIHAPLMNRSTRVIYNTKHTYQQHPAIHQSHQHSTYNYKKEKNSINAATTWENENETETKIDQ